MSTLAYAPVRLEPAAWSDLQVRKNNLILKVSSLRDSDDRAALKVAAENAAFAEWALAMHFIAGDEHSSALPNLLSAAWCFTHAGEREKALDAIDLLLAQAAQVGDAMRESMRIEADRIKARLEQVCAV